MPSLLSLTDALDALQLSSEDVEGPTALAISSAVAAITHAIEVKCGPVIKQTLTESVEPGHSLRLRIAPVLAVATINGVVMPAGARLDKRTGIIDKYVFSAGADGWVTVVYDAGRCIDLATVPKHFNEAAKLALSDLYRRTKSTFVGTPSYGAVDGPGISRYLLPMSALQMLAGEIRPVIG